MGRYGTSSIGRARRLGLGLAAALATTLSLPAAPATAAAPAMVNPGFESGDTSGWDGNGWVTSSYGGHTAPDGDYFGVVEGGCSTNAMYQTFQGRQGETLKGWSFFQANDYWPFNDSGAVQLLVHGAGGDTTVFSSSIGEVGSYGGTGWRPWSYTFPADGPYTVYASSSNGGDCGLSSAIGIDIESAPRDTTAPTITASATSGGAPYTSGTWTNQDVTVHFDCTDDSGVASLSGDQTLAEGDGQSATGTCTDTAGNAASTTFDGIRVDRTTPTVTWSGNAGTYTVDQQVTIGCTSADALSGVASSTCSEINEPAYSFGLGSHSYAASATDNAGNAGSATASFTVVVGYDSLCTLTTQLSTNKGVASGLCAKLSAAAAAAARGQARTAQNNLAAYTNQVNAQSGKAFTAAQAALLTGMVATL